VGTAAGFYKPGGSSNRAVASPPLRDAATLMLETGRRPEAANRLRVKNFNLEGICIAKRCAGVRARPVSVKIKEAAIGIEPMDKGFAGLRNRFVGTRRQCYLLVFASTSLFQLQAHTSSSKQVVPTKVPTVILS